MDQDSVLSIQEIVAYEYDLVIAIDPKAATMRSRIYSFLGLVPLEEELNWIDSRSEREDA